MIETVLTKHLDAPPVNRREILRYAGSKKSDEFDSIIDECLAELTPHLRYSVCYREFKACKDSDGIVILPFTEERSRDISKTLKNSDRFVLFAATIGLHPDILIQKYGTVSPVKSLFMEAVGSERIESLCDSFCSFFENEYSVKLTGRFSPGYGDLSLSVQRDIFKYLNCPRNIGLTLLGSNIMSPVKSVTAIAGIKKEG